MNDFTAGDDMGIAAGSRGGIRLLDPVPDYFKPAKPTELMDLYWWFAAERQKILFARLQNHVAPWTEDRILREYRFTNAYRVSDRTSQYLIKHVIYQGLHDPEEVFFRTVLFKLFNSIQTWQHLESIFGELQWKKVDLDRIDTLLARHLHAGNPIYSPAYIMPPAPSGYGHYRHKHSYHLFLLRMMMEDEMPARICHANSLSDVFNLLRAYPGIGNFLAYQYSIDINYSSLTNFSENDFVVAGPGARRGIAKCFADLGGYDEADIIRIVTLNQQSEFARCKLDFMTLWGRELHFIDCQNLFCEIDKYTRMSHPSAGRDGKRHRIKRMFSPKTDMVNLWFPPKWALQSEIAQS